MLEKYLNRFKFKQLEEYVKLIKSQTVTEESSEKYSFVTINIKLKNGLDLKVLITRDSSENDWITFYLKKDSLNVEQIEFMINNNKDDYNRIIRHDYFTVDGEIATTFNSGYTFFDDTYKSGWEETRKISFKYISHYAGHDNLANFAIHIDNSNNEVLYKSSLDDPVEPIINLVYLNREIQKVKTLNRSK